MPIYEYQCEECGHVFDALQKMSEGPLKDCPDCGEASLRKLMSAPNFRLKGGGWYETDFKDKNQRNLAGDAGKSAKSESKSGDSSGGSNSGGSSGESKSSGSDTKSSGESKPKAKPVDKSAD